MATSGRGGERFKGAKDRTRHHPNNTSECFAKHLEVVSNCYSRNAKDFIDDFLLLLFEVVAQFPVLLVHRLQVLVPESHPGFGRVDDDDARLRPKNQSGTCQFNHLGFDLRISLLVQDRFDPLYSASRHFPLRGAVNKSRQHQINYNFSGTPRIEPGAAGREGQMLHILFSFPSALNKFWNGRFSEKDVFIRVFASCRRNRTRDAWVSPSPQYLKKLITPREGTNFKYCQTKAWREQKIINEQYFLAL